MATTSRPSPSHALAKACREIHDSQNQLTYPVHSLATRSVSERLAVFQTFKQMYGEDLVSHLKTKSMVSEELHFALTLWVSDSNVRDAIVARESLKSGRDDGADFKALVEIFVGRKSSHVLMIKQCYSARFSRNLEQDILNIEPLHPFQKILVSLAASHKAHHVDASRHIAKCDAKRLFETGEGRAGSSVEEAVVLEIFCKRSISQIKLTFSCYKQIYGHHYSKMLSRKYSGEFDDTSKTVIDCMSNAPKYFAKLLHATVNGSGLNRATLARLVVGRAETDLGEIQRVYLKKYGMTLLDAVLGRFPCGDFRDFIVALISRTSV